MAGLQRFHVEQLGAKWVLVTDPQMGFVSEHATREEAERAKKAKEIEVRRQAGFYQAEPIRPAPKLQGSYSQQDEWDNKAAAHRRADYWNKLAPAARTRILKRLNPRGGERTLSAANDKWEALPQDVYIILANDNTWWS